MRASTARDQAGSRLAPVSSAGKKPRKIEAEVGSVLPNSVQDDTNAALQRDQRPLRSATAGNIATQVLSQLAFPCSVITVAVWLKAGSRLTSLAVVIPPETSLARSAARGRQADPRPDDLLRRCELAVIIDGGSIGQCHHGADPEHRHHAATCRIPLGKLADMTFQPRHCPSKRRSRPKHWLRCSLQHWIAPSSVRRCAVQTGPAILCRPGGRSSARARATTFPSDEPLLHRLVRVECRANLLRRDRLAVNRLEPTQMEQARDARRSSTLGRPWLLRENDRSRPVRA